MHGYRIANGELVPIPGSTRSLGLSNTNPPFHLSSPAQVGFTPAGTELVVTTKLQRPTVDVFFTAEPGRPASQGPGPGGPFAFTFDQRAWALVNAVPDGGSQEGIAAT